MTHKILLAVLAALSVITAKQAFADTGLTPESHLICEASNFHPIKYPFADSFNAQNSRIEFYESGAQMGSIKIQEPFELEQSGMGSYSYSKKLPNNASLRIQLGGYIDGSFGSAGYHNGLIYYYDGYRYEGTQILATIICRLAE